MADITIEIPVEIGQRWTIIGTDGRDVQSNIGPATVLGLSAGTYTIVWGLVVGTVPPFPNTFESPPLGPDDTYTFVSPTYAPLNTNITAIWANDGADKVLQEDLRALAGPVTNHAWDGSKVIISGASNEVVAFSLYLESSLVDSTNITMSFDQLDLDGTPGPSSIVSATRAPADLFKWAGSNIELFYTRYVQVEGLSIVSYDGQFYDERHVPGGIDGQSGLRRPWEPTLNPPRGTPLAGYEGWDDRPGADRYYPDILVPIEALPSQQFTVTAGNVQQVWCDIYVPKGTTQGTYTGNVSISENGGIPQLVPVQLTVYNFELNDESAAPAFVYISDYDINTRHYGANRPAGNPESITTRDNYVKMLHRHRLAVVGDDQGHLASWDHLELPSWWTARLDGTLFDDANEYDGPGKDMGNRIYPIGMYADWRAKTGWTDDTTSNKPTQSSVQARLGGVGGWSDIFDAYDVSPLGSTQPVERFWYTGDEPVKPSGRWRYAGVSTGDAAQDEFVVSNSTINGNLTIRMNDRSIGPYTDNSATHYYHPDADKGYGRFDTSDPPKPNDVIVLSRADDPENQYALYRIVSKVTAQGPLSTYDPFYPVVKVIECEPLPDREFPGSNQIAGTDLNFGDYATANPGEDEEWWITAGSKYSLWFHDINQWGAWAKGTGIKSLTTVSWGKAEEPWGVPQIDYPAHGVAFDSAIKSESTYDTLGLDTERLRIVYNGRRPLIGSFATDDDGVALTVIPWAQYRLGIDWWFYWATTLYYNYTQEAHNDLFRKAITWGQFTSDDPSKGKTGASYGNGNGVLLYPGTDLDKFPADSYGIDGPIASIRLKMWRRGIQDVEYAVAAKVQSPGSIAAIDAIVLAATKPNDPDGGVLWEIGVATEIDPGYQYADISWSTDPEDWQTKRSQLAALAEP